MKWTEHRRTVTAGSHAKLACFENSPAAGVPLSITPRSTILTLNRFRYVPQAYVCCHPAPVSWRAVGLLPKPANLARTVFPVCAGLGRNPDRMEPFSPAAVGALKLFAVDLGGPIPVPVVFGITGNVSKLHRGRIPSERVLGRGAALAAPDRPPGERTYFTAWQMSSCNDCQFAKGVPSFVS